jgi:hypothetical protein
MTTATKQDATPVLGLTEEQLARALRLEQEAREKRRNYKQAKSQRVVVMDALDAKRAIDALRAENARLREALSACFTRLECEWPDGSDGPGSSSRNPGLIRDAKDQARAALAEE